jgi:hypothetical protein
MKRKSKAEFLKDATEAHTDINMFAAVVAMLEGGTMSAGAQPDDFKIIALCKRAQQRCLHRFEQAHAALTSTDRRKETP